MVSQGTRGGPPPPPPNPNAGHELHAYAAAWSRRRPPKSDDPHGHDARTFGHTVVTVEPNGPNAWHAHARTSGRTHIEIRIHRHRPDGTIEHHPGHKLVPVGVLSTERLRTYVADVLRNTNTNTNQGESP